MVNKVLLSIVPMLILVGYVAGEEVLPTQQPDEQSEQQHPAPEGGWKRWGMVYECDGYLSRDGSKDFCEQDVPANWIPFEYEAQTYYIAPLAAERRESE